MKKLIRILKKSVMYFILIVISIIIIGFAIYRSLEHKQLNILRDIIKKSDYISFSYINNFACSLDMNSLPLEKKKEDLLDLLEAFPSRGFCRCRRTGFVEFYIKGNQVCTIWLSYSGIDFGNFSFYGDVDDAEFDYILGRRCSPLYY